MGAAHTFETSQASGWRTIENRHTGERLQLRRVVKNGVLALELKGTLPPHQEGPPLHVHVHEDEEGTVLAGTLTAQVGGERIELGVGQAGRFPAGVPHRWWNAHDEPLEFSGVTRKLVDLDEYLLAAFDIVNSGPPNRPPLFYMAHLAWRHRRNQAVLLAPRWLQAIAVPVIVFIGTVLGRYQGTDWPGCPARLASAGAAGESARQSTSVARAV